MWMQNIKAINKYKFFVIKMKKTSYNLFFYLALGAISKLTNSFFKYL